MIICPFCEKPNDCRVDGECWCFHIDVPKELLDRLPPENLNKTCICLACITRYKQNPEAFLAELRLGE